MKKFNTRGERTLDLIITNLSNFYQSPVRFPPFGLADHFTIVTKPTLRPKTVTRKLFVQVRDLRVSSKVALGRYLSSIDWSVLDNLVSCQSKLDFFTNILKAGIDTIMPLKTVRIHINDAPWMTAQLKDLINCRQKALAQGNQALFKFYRNRVNKERKFCRANYYQSKVKEYEGTNPRLWWSKCKRLCGMTRKPSGVCKSRNPTRNTRNTPGTPGTPPGTPGTHPEHPEPYPEHPEPYPEHPEPHPEHPEPHPEPHPEHLKPHPEHAGIRAMKQRTCFSINSRVSH